MMDLNKLEQKLKNSTTNQLEYYKEGKKHVVKFSEVYHDVKKIITFFTTKQLKPGSIVGILGKNSYEWVVIDLACVIRGIITIPLETSKSFEVDELFTTFELDLLATNLPEYSFTNIDNVLTFDDIIRLSKETVAADQPHEIFSYKPDDIFTLIFTSGTLGKSKFIEVRKKSFDHLIQETQELYDFKPEDRFLVFLPLPIYLERCYVYSAILIGFDIIITPLEFVFHSIQNDKPSIIIGVPYFFENFMSKFLEKIESKFLYSFVYHSYLLFCSIGLGFLFKNKFSPFVKAWGGNIRYLLTGSAPTNKKTLLFYQKMGITLYEGYGMSEIGGMITLNSPGYIRLGSVGKPFPGKKVTISETGEIIVQGELMANNHYYKLPKEESDKTYIHSDSVATGDIGYFDKDGFLYINGRIKDILVLSSGKKIHPTILEELIMSSGLFVNVLVYGDNKPYLVAVVVPKLNSITFEQVEAEFKKLNAKLTIDEKILKFYLFDQPFTIQNTMLTNSLKLNRKNIIQHLSKEIENLY